VLAARARTRRLKQRLDVIRQSGLPHPSNTPQRRRLGRADRTPTREPSSLCLHRGAVLGTTRGGWAWVTPPSSSSSAGNLSRRDGEAANTSARTHDPDLRAVLSGKGHTRHSTAL